MPAMYPLAAASLASPGLMGAVAVAPATPITVVQTSCFGLTTAGDVIERALKAILVEGADSALEADEYADSLDALNDYMAMTEANGICLGYTRVCNIADTVTVPDSVISGIVANLAIYMAPDFSGVVSAGLAKRAKEGMRAMRRVGRKNTATQLPSTLPSGAGNYDNVTLWSNYYEKSVAATYTLSGNRLVTSISASSAAVKVQGHWSIEQNTNLHADISGRITNTGDKVTLTLNASFTGTGSTSSGIVGFAKSNVISIYTESAFTSSPVTVLVSGTVTLDTGEYLDVVVADLVSTNDMAITDARVRLT